MLTGADHVEADVAGEADLVHGVGDAEGYGLAGRVLGVYEESEFQELSSQRSAGRTERRISTETSSVTRTKVPTLGTGISKSDQTKVVRPRICIRHRRRPGLQSGM